MVPPADPQARERCGSSPRERGWSGQVRGFLPGLEDREQISLNDVDGNFGPTTNDATRQLQARWGLGADGKVGGGTFGRADDNLYKTGGSEARGKTLYLRYNGSRYRFDLRRNTEGKYLFQDRKRDWRQAGYDYLTCADV